MGDKSGTHARRKSRRLQKAAPSSTPVIEPQQHASSDLSPAPHTHDEESHPALEFPASDEDFQVEPHSLSHIHSSITPPPKKRKAPAKKAAASSDSDDDALTVDDMSSPPKKKVKATSKTQTKGKKKQKAKKGKKDQSDSEDGDLGKRRLMLSVPRAAEVGNQRLNFTHETGFSEALDAIHATVGCADLARKPVLTYKLATSAGKDPAMSLSTVADWEGCLWDVRQAENAKKAGTVISVMILVTQQYLDSVKAKKGKTPATKGRNKKLPILDLDHAESGDDDFDEGLGTMEHETKCLEQLDSKYGHCQACGPTKICKITVTGTHHHLSNNQRRAWAQALVLKKLGVTINTPPRDMTGQNLFGMFFKSMLPSETFPQTATQPVFPGQPGPAYPSMPNYTYPPWMYPPPLQPMIPAPTHIHDVAPNNAGPSRASGSRLPADLPSSDPPDMGEMNPYAEIPDFLRELDGYASCRQLLDYIPIFRHLDLYNIDEIQQLGSADELVKVTNSKISYGNAKFIMAQVKNEIKRVDRHRLSLG
ncbi:hypothetical protein DFH06DRAFT_362923 [Mycena polygramma]|nr:hypothetical protein DFH06DRAFT_362923 [Mycena polygramma]